MPQQTEISIKNLSAFYDDTEIFNEVTFELKKGDKAVITAESGKGKSTLLSQILGFTRIENGEIEVMGRQVNRDNINAIRSKTSWLPQETGLFQESIRELLMQPFQYKQNKEHLPSEDKIVRTLNNLGLNEAILHKDSYEVSGGELQRVLLASIHLLNKDIVLLDEPTSALDMKNAEKVRELFRNMDSTIIIASHDEHWNDVVDKEIVL